MPGHSGASHGINRIKDLYLAWAQAARQRGQWAKAQSFAERAATVDPQDTDVAQLLDQIKAERKLETEVAALKEFEVEKAKAAVPPMEEAKASGDINFHGLVADEEVAKISVVGIGMRSHAGVAAKMFDALSAEGVNIKVIATSEIKISVLIDRKSRRDWRRSKRHRC